MRRFLPFAALLRSEIAVKVRRKRYESSYGSTRQDTLRYTETPHLEQANIS